MKTTKTIWLGLLIIAVVSCAAGKRTTSIKKTLPQKVETKDFTFYVDRCLPTGLEISTYNSDVVIRLKDSTAYGNLPFHGLLSVNPMEMTEGPITFNGLMKGFTKTYNPAKGWNILFKVVGEPYTYQVEMQISTKGKAVVKVTSTKRSTMTYFGEVD